MTNTIQSIANRINNFDFSFSMSDSDRVYDRGATEKESIKEVLDQMSETELIEVRGQINDDVFEYSRFFYFASYFENLPTDAPEAVSGAHEQDDTQQPTASKTASTRSEIFTNAWSMFRKGLFASFANALRAAWQRFKLVRALRIGIAYFSFTKASGEIREAIGTLAGNNFDYQYKGQRSTDKPEVVKYWDVEKRAFRSCRIDRLVAVS